MRLLWSARLELPADSLPKVMAILEAWLRSPKRELSFTGPFQPGDVSFPTGGRLQVDQVPEAGVPTSWALRYERIVAEQGLIWTTDLAFETRDNRVLGHARLYQRSIASGRPRFERVVLRPPGFIFKLRNQGLLGEGRFQVRSIAAEGVDAFLQDVTDPRRQYPIVAVSVEPYTERPLVDTRSLQDELIGIAQVVEITKGASLVLPRHFELRGVKSGRGKVWGVYGGAVKVYRPKVDITETPFNHPIWLPADASDPGFAATLKDWCWSVAALETPEVGTDVASIRRLHEAAVVPPAATALSPDEMAEVYQSYLTEEQQKTAEQAAKADMAQARADELADTVRLLESKIQALQFQLSRKTRAVYPEDVEDASAVDITTADEAVERARREFSGTLLIPASIEIDTGLEGAFWYGVFLALHRLCELERQGQAKNKRELLRQLLEKHVNVSKDTYKVADTGVYVTNPDDSLKVHLRERVHLREGKPAETESVYWQTVGTVQSSYRYLIGRLGRHA